MLLPPGENLYRARANKPYSHTVFLGIWEALGEIVRHSGDRLARHAHFIFAWLMTFTCHGQTG
jgi:hypothetical protein